MGKIDKEHLTNAAAGMQTNYSFSIISANDLKNSVNYKVGDLVLYHLKQLSEHGNEYVMGCVQRFKDDGLYAEVLWWDNGKDEVVPHDIYDVNRFRKNYLDFLKHPGDKKVVDF
jgi:hypothetical protein